MSRDDHAFISGLIKKYRPKKIVEVGVDTGGTSVLIIKSLEMIECKSKFISVDIDVYRKGYKVGYILNKFENSGLVDHSLLTGKLLLDRMDEIGDNIDLTILDTAHKIPGEIFEFLTILPFMSKNGIILMHDINLSNLYALDIKKVLNSFSSIATKVLFPAISGEKFYNCDERGFNNIGAVRINEHTMPNIGNVFFTLTNIWYLEVKKEIIEKYRIYFEKYYPEEYVSFFNIYASQQSQYKHNIALVRKYFSFYNKCFRNLQEIYRTMKKLLKTNYTQT